MRDTTPVASGKPNQATRTGEGFFGINIKDLSVEEICERANIQSNILDLQSKDSEEVKSALNTLSSITRFTDRKDALYVLVGYYKLEIRTLDEIIDFFRGTRMALSIDLSMIILNDLIKRKDISRRRIFLDDFLQQLRSVFIDTADDEKEEMRTLIENSAWGDKLKRKFLDNLFYEEF
ncbi:MAG: hypothetical protein AAGB97_08995 [Dehalococcoidia bacterium]|nr:hypothetical protein [Chloroflexota bacterium]MBT9162689.1 hypothetical protein [Chloroflexota bacterium]